MMRRLSIIAALALLGAAPAAPVDLLIRGGTVYPGDAPSFVGDVAVKGRQIWARGRSLDLPAVRVIDATGMIVAPGFIDPHTHAGPVLMHAEAERRLIPAFLMQGVTTAFIGNDGGGMPEVAATLVSWQTRPVGINYATFVGFGPIRERVLGNAARAPSAAELDRMRALVAKGMCEGAIGFSTGLFYAPQSFARTAEVVALAREAGRRFGVYDSHIRDESSYGIGLAASVAEALTIGREAKLPVHIAHIKALGVDVHGQAPKIVTMIEAARKRGVRVTADQYPWDASGTSLTAALVPIWAQDGGRARLLARFDDATLAGRLARDMAENLRRRGGADKLLITQGTHRGRTLAAVAGTGDPVAAVIATIRVADPSVISFNMRGDDIRTFMRQWWVLTGSDASPGHPRTYGSFARKWSEYVVKAKVLTPAEFIRRSSTLTAETFGLDAIGSLTVGKNADIVVFDPATYAARATYAAPNVTATGVRTVIVGGQVAVDDGRLTGVANGRSIVKLPGRGTCR